MSKVTISLPDAINTTIESRARAAGFATKEEYPFAFVQADCDRGELEPVLEARLDGPFEPLELDWKQPVKTLSNVVARERIERHPAVIESDRHPR